MVERIRLVSQHFFFVLLMYGERLGINLGHSLPCFSCPYVQGCAGHCYLMVLQREFVGFQTSADIIFSSGAFHMLWPFAVFLLFFIPLSKFWCAWICPFCLFQDWITLIRKKLGIRPAVWSRKTRQAIRPVKYIFLALLILIPLAIANVGLHPDWGLPFCQICPAKPILPLFAGDTSHIHIDMTNAVTMGFTLTAMILTAGFLVGMFFKERFFCMFCPLLALMHLCRGLSPVKFEKDVHRCTGCGNCQRMCPVDIADVHLEKKQKNVLTEDCMGCMSCVEACPVDDALAFSFGLGKWRFKLFSSSGRYLAKKWSRL